MSDNKASKTSVRLYLDTQILINIMLCIFGVVLTIMSFIALLPFWTTILVMLITTYYAFACRFRILALRASNVVSLNDVNDLTNDLLIKEEEKVPVLRSRLTFNSVERLHDTTYRYGPMNPLPSQDENEALWETDRDSRLDK